VALAVEVREMMGAFSLTSGTILPVLEEKERGSEEE
jgi:hypothetical protein